MGETTSYIEDLYVYEPAPTRAQNSGAVMSECRGDGNLAGKEG